jgi:hypothetical protein
MTIRFHYVLISELYSVKHLARAPPFLAFISANQIHAYDDQENATYLRKRE